ncbi:phage tail spike protein [Bacillus licheniformis]|uniref:phage tail spike protein n=1 Tax=Bacillus licheniformis TaxID=1402 RepID=UPI002DBC5A5E|nr:phage tail spike protein [Bacillus licheniformis]MEC1351700.1 phage tail spike protein [Bacillus licheniformis]
MADLWILDKNDSLLTILSSDADNACVFWDAIFREELNKSSTFQFTCDATHKDSKHVAKLNQVVFKDKDGFFRLFKIREIDRTNGDNQAAKIAQCEPAELELLEKIIDDIRPYNTTQLDALQRALVGTRWKANVTASNGINSTNFYHISVYEAITDIINTWGGELKFTVTFDTKTNKIVERVVNIVQRRGADNGTRFEVGYNIEEIHETEMAYPVSALWGWGGSVEDENGNDSRFIDFADVVWSKANGDPVDKPKGQKWVEYPPAKEKFGLQTPDGVINVEGKWQDENIKDPVELLQKTYHHLVNEASQIQTNYSFEVALTNETVELGDTCLALDRTIPDPIEFFGRVIALEYDVSDQTFPATVEMGQFLSVYEPDTRLDRIEDKIREIEQGRDIVVDDGSFPDTKPPTPKNVVAKGLFEKVAIDWYYETFSYIAAYEVYGSQVKDFTPDTVNFSNRLWRGKAGGWIHEAAVNQVWYYRIRTVNTRGTASAFTAQFSAATTRIGTNHIEDQSITNAKIKDLSADKITAGTINGITIRGSLIQGARFEAANQNENFKSWLENGTFYQWTRDSNYNYNKLTITSGMLEQETGWFYRDGDTDNKVHSIVRVGNGRLSISGVPGQNTNSFSPKVDIFTESHGNFNPDNIFDTTGDIARYQMSRGDKAMLNIASGDYDYFYDLKKDTWVFDNVESRYAALFEGSQSIIRFKPVNFDVIASGGIRLKTTKGVNFDTGGRGIFLTGSSQTIGANGTLTLKGNATSSSSVGDLNIGVDGRGPRVWSSSINNRTTTAPANLHMNQYGNFEKVTSSQKYKINIEEFPKDRVENILKLNPKTWFDKLAVEAYAEILESGREDDEDKPYLERIPGLIAEDVFEAGLKEFVFYGKPDENGNREIEGVMYDRLFALLIPIVRDLKTRIENIESALN